MAVSEARSAGFGIRQSSEFMKRDVDDLAAGECAAIRVPDCISTDARQELLEALSRQEFESYGEHRVYPVVKRFGTAVSDYRVNGAVNSSYWNALSSSRTRWAELGLSFDVFELCRTAIGRQWNGSVAVGRRGDRELGPGVIREPNEGFVVHFDDANREFPDGLLDDHLISQFAFNLYLSVPERGGQTVVWRHRWSPVDESHRIPNSYGYLESVVDGAESVEIEPRVGDAVLLDSRNFHAVRPSLGARRIAVGFSVGLSADGALRTWG